MSPHAFILHHYDPSPYAEKIRLLLGMAGMSWRSVLSPAMPPRPNVEPLVGGYRRIPVAQLGADVFCDSRLIAAEIAHMSGLERLSPDCALSAPVRALIQRAEGDAFFAAAGAAPPHVLLGTIAHNFGLRGTLRFAIDRFHMIRSAASKPPIGRAAMRVYRRFCADLNDALAQQPLFGGDQPGYADAALYHVVWLNVQARRAPLTDALPHLKRWFDRIARVGHGERAELPPSEAFAAARNTTPRPLPERDTGDALAAHLGRRVAIHPADYLPEPTVGELVAVTEARFVVAREVEGLGEVHVHFPRAGYALTRQ